MKARRWSHNQKKVLRLGDIPERFIFIVGTPGSGKTATGIAGFMIWALQFRGAQFGIVGKTLAQAEQVAGTELVRFCREMGIRPRSRSVGGRPVYRMGGNQFILFGANNAKATETLQGYDLAGVYVDEVVNLPRQYMYEVDNRLRSIDQPKLVMTANAGARNHWFKIDWLDRADIIGLRTLKLFASDNPSLSHATIESFKKTSVGGWYKRRVLNEWASLTGQVYPAFSTIDPPAKAEASSWFLSVDPADSGTTAALLIGRFGERYIVYDEWIHDGRDGQLTHQSQARRIARWIDGNGISVRYGICDPSSPNMMVELNRALDIQVRGANNDVLNGIAATQALLAHENLLVSKTCRYLLGELESYQWDEKAAERGEDKPLKEYDHACDALRYFVYSNNHSRELRIRYEKLPER